MSNTLGFNRPMSGATIADIQAAVNKLYTATGASESQTGTVYNATPGTITNGDPYQTALTLLAGKFDPATGHFHTGAPGDGPILNTVTSIAASGFSPINGAVTLVGTNGETISESGNTLFFQAPNRVSSLAASGFTPLINDVELVAGPNITLTQAGQQITVTATAGGSGGGILGPLLTPDASSGNQVIPAGFSLFWPYLEVSAADTFSVNLGGQLAGFGSLAVSGTLINNGIVRVV